MRTITHDMRTMKKEVDSLAVETFYDFIEYLAKTAIENHQNGETMDVADLVEISLNR